MEYHNVETTLFNWYTVIFILICVVIWFFGKVSLNKRLYYFGVSWFFICLIPVTNILVALSSTVRQHWASFAILGLLFSISTLIKDFHSKKIKLCVGVFFIAFILLTSHRISIWSDPIILYQNDLKYEPNSFVLWNNLGYEMYKNKKYDLAENYFLKSLYSAPGYSYDVALNNLGVINEMKGNYVLAKYYYKKSIISGDYKLAKMNLKRITDSNIK